MIDIIFKKLILAWYIAKFIEKILPDNIAIGFKNWVYFNEYSIYDKFSLLNNINLFYKDLSKEFEIV